MGSMNEAQQMADKHGNGMGDIKKRKANKEMRV